MRVVGKLAVKSLRYRKFSVISGIFSIALGVVLLLGVERIRSQVEESFSNTISGTDLIVGARTGDLSLLLSSIFHIGYANQNVSYATFQTVSGFPEVKWAIPLSLGDSFRGYAVLGTTGAYFEHYSYGLNKHLVAATGRLELNHKEAILGAKVATELNYMPGDTVLVTHGMGEEDFIVHRDEPFIVTGILEPTGTPLDRVIHVSLFAMDEIHEHFYREDGSKDDPLAMAGGEIMFSEEVNSGIHGDPRDPFSGNDEGKPPKILTAFMLGLNDHHDVLSLQRRLNEYKPEPLTAILPAVALMDLWKIVSPIEKGLLIISVLVLLVTFAGMLTTLVASLRERRREMAVLRSVGASANQIFRLIVIESTGISGLGILLGTGLLFLLLFLLKPSIALHFGILFPVYWLRINELLLLLIIWFAGAMTGLWPAYQSYKASLADGLIIKI